MPLRIRPAVMPVLGRDGSVVFGAGRDAIRVLGIGSKEVAALRLVDGTRSERDLLHAARSRGVEPTGWQRLLDILRSHDIVHDVPQAPGGRRSGTVQVVDTGPVLPELRRLLEDSGTTVDEPLGHLAAPPSPVRPPRLVIAVGLWTTQEHLGVSTARALAWWHEATVVLPVSRAPGDALFGRVGPLLAPSADSPCPNCVARQLRRGSSRLAPDDGGGRVDRPSTGARGAAVGFDRMLAGVTAMLVADVLDADPVLAPGVSVDVEGPLPNLCHRRWLVDPGCPEHAGLPSY